MIRLFLSSVRRGFEELRARLLEDLRTAGFDVANMEIFGARPELPLETCLAEIRKCDALILIVGPRYGALTEAGDVSFTHEEFREACRRGIPVLAFTLPPAPDAPDDKKQRLREFTGEVGQAVVYKSTDATNLRSDIVTTLLQQIQARRLGRRFAFFQTHDKFFAQQLQEQRLFNHLLPLVGRSDILETLTVFLRSDAPAQVLTAPGGAGKSRLLLELARLSEQDSKLPQLRFATAESRWTSEDIAELPTTPVVVVLDDGHRRADLDALIQACLTHNSESRFLVSCRPALVDGVRYHLRTIESGNNATAPIQLTALEEADTLELARNALADELAGLAERLVRASDGNPLVIVVGGRCIATRRVDPEVLDRTPKEFQRIVLDRMLDDPLFAGAEGRLRRDVLDVVATIGPVSMEDRTVPENIAEFVGSQSHEVRAAMGELARAGFLMRRGRLARVTPDVLGDHLLFCKAVSANGQPTGFVDSIFETFSPGYLGNIVSNAAELDWRTAALGGEVEVLERTWQRITDRLPSLSHPARSELVSNLRRAAIFTPMRVLDVLEWLLRHPDAPEDPMLAGLGLTSSPRVLQDAICELLKIIATHPDYTRRCVDALIPIVPGDDRRTNQYPAHPRRVLEDLAGYELDRHLACQRTVVETIRDVVRDAPPDSPVAWGAPVFGAALVRSGESHRGTRHGLTIRGFPLSESLDRIAPIREVAIEGLVSLCDRQSAGDAAAAVAELAKLLDVPHGIFGREVTKEEIGAWVPEARQAGHELATIATEAPLDVTRYLARRELRNFRDEFWPDIASEVQQVLQRTLPIQDEAFFDLLIGLPYHWHTNDYQAERACAATCATDVAHDLAARYDDLDDLLHVLAEKVTYVGQTHGVDAQNYAEFARALAAEHSDHKIKWANAIIQHPADPIHRLLPAALLTIKKDCQQDAFSRLIDAVCQSPHKTLRAVTANSFFYLVDSDSADRSDLDLLKRFLEDPSTTVRRAAIWPLGRFQEKLPDEVTAAAVSVEIEDDADLAEQLCGLFRRHERLGPTGLTDEQVDQLLAKLQPLPRLESRTHNVLTFVAYASKQRPRTVVEMLLSRIQKACVQDQREGEERYDPIPIGGHGLSLPGLRESEQYPELLRQIRDAASERDAFARHHLATLFCAAADLQAAAEVLKEWTSSGDSEKVVAAASLLRNFHSDVVFSLADFVADTLDDAERLGAECYEAVCGQLFGVAISGVWSSAPGEPSPHEVSQRARASEFAEKYAERAPVRRFYENLARHAEASIRRELDQFEEEEFE